MTICSAWITEQDLADCKMCTPAQLAAPQVEHIIETATQILYLLSGQQFPGQCVDTVRPCNCQGCGVLRTPIRYGSGWVNVCGSCSGYCGAAGQAILLPKRPVIDVVSVFIDGSSFSDFRLDSPGWLVRTDGGTWPTCQDITQDVGSAGTWEVMYTWGKVPPAALRYAATILSSELVKACLGDGTCRIPAGAVTVQRQGVTYNFDIAEGKTGLMEVDLVLDAFNPGHRTRRARVYSPQDIQWARTQSGS